MWKLRNAPVGRQRKSRKRLKIALGIIGIGLLFFLAFPSAFITISESILGSLGELQPVADDRPITADIDEQAQQLIERKIHFLVNEERTKRGIGELSYDSALASIARLHSLDMGLAGFFDHVNPRGQDSTDRAVLQGYSCTVMRGDLIYEGVGENIWMTDDLYRTENLNLGSNMTANYDSIARMIVLDWMGSRGHRDNILNDIYEQEGIGISIGQEGLMTVTQNFC